MELDLNMEKMKRFMQNFYITTGVRSAVYDSNYRKVIAYPEKNTGICQLMHENERSNLECHKSNMKAFELCNRAENTIVYKCHVGLNEVITPLKDKDVIIGYVIFGQISNEKDHRYLLQLIEKACKKYNMLDIDLKSEIKNIHIKTTQEILAIAKILEACTYYIIYNDMIRLSKADFLSKMDRYIEGHISETITVNKLCSELGVSKTKLYEIVNDRVKKSIARYIKEKRIDRAKILLRETELSIFEIAQMVGIGDYNYFCAVFKKMTGMTAKKYRDRK
ncbi:PocR ligand-binding domain-containing protein [Robinsoniella peoriensis]